MPKNDVEKQQKSGKTYLNEIKKGLSAVENKERAYNSRKLIEQNKFKQNRTRLVQQLFMAMQDMGVDPSNLESINEFLAKLSEQDPDLLRIFELGFGGLQEQEPATTVPEAPAEPAITNNFENLRNQVFNRK